MVTPGIKELKIAIEGGELILTNIVTSYDTSYPHKNAKKALEKFSAPFRKYLYSSYVYIKPVK